MIEIAAIILMIVFYIYSARVSYTFQVLKHKIQACQTPQNRNFVQKAIMYNWQLEHGHYKWYNPKIWYKEPSRTNVRYISQFFLTLAVLGFMGWSYQFLYFVFWLNLLFGTMLHDMFINYYMGVSMFYPGVADNANDTDAKSSWIHIPRFIMVCGGIIGYIIIF